MSPVLTVLIISKVIKSIVIVSFPCMIQSTMTVRENFFTVSTNSSMLLGALFVTMKGLFAKLNINDTQRKQHSAIVLCVFRLSLIF